MMRQTFSEFMGCEDWDNAELCELVDKLHRHIIERDTLLAALWTRVDAEYPQGGFPDMGVFEDKLKYMGVI